MNLYANLELEREPFSNSPDPNFLHETRQHATCLQELEISLRLRRGLNVITGDIGTGKTTLCRSLLRTFSEDAEVDIHLLLDPHFDTSEEFLRVILGSVARLAPDPCMGLWELKEALKQQLFRLGMVERRLVVLVIDEGQKISPANLELLREMLNYETNSSKLLQIVIFAQRELEPMLAAMPNLADRINVRRRLTNLSLAETRRMIRHRLRVAGTGEGAPLVRFSAAAIVAIHLASGGSPRKIVRLCHMAMLEMLVRGKTGVGLFEARTAVRPGDGPSLRRRRAMALAVSAVLCLGLGSLWLTSGPAGPVLGSRVQADLQPDRPAELPAVTALKAEAPLDATAEAAAAAKAGTPAPRTPQAPPESSSAALAPEGLTLLPEREESSSAPTGLTLLPPRDQGPAVRSPIGRGTLGEVAPAGLRVAAPDDGEGAARGMYRTVAFNTAGR